MRMPTALAARESVVRLIDRGILRIEEAIDLTPTGPQRLRHCLLCNALRFFDWYNQDHHHSGIGLMTPDQVHYGQIDAVHAARQVTLDQVFRKKPERFVKPPVPPAKPTATWINPPTPKKPA
jgi:hypothetical protein